MNNDFNKEWTESHSKENLTKMLESKDRNDVASAEALLGVCKYPDDYWVMPDYYYPGIDFKTTSFNFYNNIPENNKLLTDITANDFILILSGYTKESESTFSLAKINESSDDIYGIDISKDNETITLTNEKGQIVNIPWETFCAIFLKARELRLPRPDVLDHAGPADKRVKEKWLANQEKIKELQSEID